MTSSWRPARRRTCDNGSSLAGVRLGSRRRSLIPSFSNEPPSRSRVIAQHPGSAGRAQHPHRPLRAVAVPDVDRAGCCRSHWSECQEVCSSELHRVGSRRVRCQADVDTRKLFEQAANGLDRRVDASLDVGGADSVSISIDEDTEREATGNLIKAKTDGGTARDRLRPREPEPGGEVPGRSMATRVISGRQRLKQGDARECRGHADDGHQLDQGITCARRPRARHASAASSTQRGYSDFGVVTVINAFIFRKLFSPMPRTFIRSSTFLKPPFFCRYSRIRSAVDLPMPGRVSSWATLAVFRLIGVPLEAAGTAAFVDERAPSCADAAVATSPNIRTIAVN